MGRRHDAGRRGITLSGDSSELHPRRIPTSSRGGSHAGAHRAAHAGRIARIRVLGRPAELHSDPVARRGTSRPYEAVGAAGPRLVRSPFRCIVRGSAHLEINGSVITVAPFLIRAAIGVIGFGRSARPE